MGGKNYSYNNLTTKSRSEKKGKHLVRGTREQRLVKWSRGITPDHMSSTARRLIQRDMDTHSHSLSHTHTHTLSHTHTHSHTLTHTHTLSHTPTHTLTHTLTHTHTHTHTLSHTPTHTLTHTLTHTHTHTHTLTACIVSKHITSCSPVLGVLSPSALQSWSCAAVRQAGAAPTKEATHTHKEATRTQSPVCVCVCVCVCAPVR